MEERGVLAIPLFILFVMIVVVVIVVSSRRRAKRRAARQEFVTSNQMREITAREQQREVWSGLVTGDLFETGHEGVRWMAIDESQAVVVTLAEHAWTRSDLEGNDTIYVHTLACTTSVRGLPALHVRDRGMRAIGSAGSAEVFASGDAALDKRCVLCASDHARALAVLSPNVRAWFCAMPMKCGCLLDSRGITMYRRGHCSTNELAELSRRLRALVRLLARE